MKLDLIPVLGLPEYTAWSALFKSEDQKTVLLLVVDGQDAANVGSELLDILSNSVIDTAPIFHQVLQELISFSQNKAVNLHLSAIFRLNGQVYLACKDSQIFLKRDRKFGSLLNSNEKLKLIEGELKIDDVLIFLSQKSSKFLQEIQQKLESGFQVDSVISSLIARIQQEQKPALSAILFAQALDFVEIISEEEELEYIQDTHDTKKDAEYVEELEEEDSNLEQLLTIETPVSVEKKNRSRHVSRLVPSVSSLTRGVEVLRVSTSRVGMFIPSMVETLMSKFKRQKGEVAYLDESKRKKRLLRFALFSLIILIPITVLVLWQMNVRGQQLNQVNEYLETIDERIAEAKEKQEQDPIESRSLLELSLNEIDVLNTKFEKKAVALKALAKKKEEINDFYKSISAREEFSELETFFDLRYLESQKDFIVSQADLVGNKAVFLDEGKKVILSFNVENKSAEKLPIDENSSPRAMSLSENEIWILGDGIYKYSFDDDSYAQVKESGDSNNNAKYISHFADYVYVFNAAKRNIFRYAPTEDGYSDPVGWFQDKQGLDFDSISGMSIDGDVWLTNKSGEIKRYVRGNPEAFEIRGLNEAITSNISLFTKENFKNIYVLEPEKNRLLVIAKNGDLIKEIKSVSLASATEILVSEDESRAFAISGSLLFLVPNLVF